MSRNAKRLLLFMGLTLFISGCQWTAASEPDTDPFRYKGAYVGDNSAVSNTIRELHGAEYFDGFKLETTDEPYGLHINYDWSEAEENAEKTAIENATYLFAILRNADWVSFHFKQDGGQETYTVSREDLQVWYGQELDGIESEEETEALIKEAWKSGKQGGEVLKQEE